MSDDTNITDKNIIVSKCDPLLGCWNIFLTFIGALAFLYQDVFCS